MKKDLPIYKGDRIATRKKGHLSLRLNDGSILSLAGNTEITVTQSLYSPGSENRSSFMNMVMGKARFWVKKLSNFKKKDFKVKTRTAVVGVRGSDFVIETDENLMNVCTLENTRLEIGIFGGCDNGDCKAQYHPVSDFQRASLIKGMLKPEIRKLARKEIKQINAMFPKIRDTGEFAFTTNDIRFSEKDFAKPDAQEMPEPDLEIDAETNFADEPDEIAEEIEETVGELPPYPDNPDR